MKYYFLLFGVVLLFFYQIFLGKIPFPGDLLVNNYEPYRTYPVGGFPSGAAVPSKLQGADVIRHIFPWKHFSVESTKKREIPFWNPHNFSGNPLMGNFQSAVFYPLNFVFYIFPFNTAWTIYIIFIPILSSIFMYLFLRELKLSPLSSVFGAVVFAFSSYMTVWMEWGNIGHTFLWLPLCLFLTENLIKKLEIKYYVFLVLSLFVSLLAGYLQVYFYMTVTIFFYFLVKTLWLKSFTVNKLILFLTSLIFPVILSLFQVLPTVDLFLESSRFDYSLSKIQYLLNPWWYLVTLLAPNFFGNPANNNHWFYGTYIERVSYIGFIPFILFLYAIFNYKKRIEIKIFGGIAILTFFLVTDFFVTKYFFTIPFPLISTTVPTRILAIFQFSAIVLAAIGLDFLRVRFNKKSLYLSLLLIFITLLIAWSYTFSASGIDSKNLEISRRNLLIPTALFLTFSVSCFLWMKKKFKFVTFIILGVTVIELFYFFHKITPFSPKEFIYPNTPVIKYLQENAGINRFWGYGSGYVEGNFQTFDKTFSPEGVDPIHIRRYTRLLEAAKSGKITMELPRPDANIPPGFGKDDLKRNIYRQRLLNLLGVKYVLHKSMDESPDYETFPQSIYKLVYHDGRYHIYENKEVLPRAFLAGNYVVATDKQKIVDFLFDPNFDLKKTLVLEEKVPSVSFMDDDESQVKITSYGNNEVKIQTFTKSNMLLFLSDTYFNRWIVKVDGKPVKIYRADYAFRAVPVMEGSHEVVFRYESLAFKTGLWIALGAFILFLLGIFYVKKKYKHEKI